MKTINRNELKEKINQNENFTLLEILPLESFQKGHLPRAKNMPLDQVEAKIENFVPQKNQDIVVYCASDQCSASHQAAEKLTKLGYTQVHVYVGGKKDWISAGLPTTSTSY